MRIAAASLIAAFGFTAAALSANATPLVPPPLGAQSDNIIAVAGGCGRGFHPNRYGRCSPNRYSHAPRPTYRGYPGSSDYVANQLNRQELGRWGY